MRDWNALTHRSMSWLEVDSSGLWLMPPFSPRTKSMACGISSCSFIESWPAPLGMVCTGRPRPATACAQRACQAASLGAAGTRIASSMRTCTHRRSPMARRPSRMSFAQASRAASVVARTSRLKLQRPGTTLIEPLDTCSMPTVATTSGTADAQRSASSTSSAAAAAASRRRSIGVVPAWLAMPVISPR